MKADLLLTGIAQLVSAGEPGPLRGSAQGGALAVTNDAALAVQDARVAWAGAADAWRGEALRTLDLQGRAVLPGLVDPHTHLLWAGDRLDDFEARSGGESYEQLLARGGGIRSTVAATAAASEEELVDASLPRVDALLASGATTLEVKSGYGGSVAAELRSLQAIAALQARTPARLVPTLLLHVPPLEGRSAFVSEVIAGLLPEVARRGLARRVDVYLDRGAFDPREARAILAAARAHGLERTLHVDQFSVLGGVELGIELEARSVDHLEASGAAEASLLAGSGTVATLLPGASLELGLRHADGRALVDAGAAVAVASDLNPGSSPLFSTALALALSVRLNGLRPAEAMVAGTANAAAALGRPDVGRLAEGCLADMLVLPGGDWRALLAELPRPGTPEVWIGGRPLVASAA